MCETLAAMNKIRPTIYRFAIVWGLINIFSQLAYSQSIDARAEQEIMSGDSSFLVQDPNTFTKCLEILKALDNCSTQPSYNKENTSFYKLGSQLLLIETSETCGLGGACSNRILVVKNDTQIVYEDQHSWLHSVRDSASFYTVTRGYQTGEAMWEVQWVDNTFTDKPVSRNGIPWSILEQLPLRAKDPFDHFSINKIGIMKYPVNNKGALALFVHAPYYEEVPFDMDKYSDPGSTNWLFFDKGDHQYQLTNVFYGVRSHSVLKEQNDGYFDLLIEEFNQGGLTHIPEKKRYYWDGTKYVFGGRTEVHAKIDSLKFVRDVPYMGRYSENDSFNIGCGDQLFWDIVKLYDRNAIPLLIEKLDDTTKTELIAPLFGFAYTVGDVAYVALNEIVINIPTFELLGVEFDQNGCGYCSYWKHLNKSYENRKAFKKNVKSWFEENNDKMGWFRSDRILTGDCSGKHPNGGHFKVVND